MRSFELAAPVAHPPHESSTTADQIVDLTRGDLASLVIGRVLR
jgi:hypothetical protein